MKAMEDLKVHYDYTVRNANNNIVQILYADTGIDPRKLVSVKFPTVSINNNLFKK